MEAESSGVGVLHDHSLAAKLTTQEGAQLGSERDGLWPRIWLQHVPSSGRDLVNAKRLHFDHCRNPSSSTPVSPAMFLDVSKVFSRLSRGKRTIFHDDV